MWKLFLVLNFTAIVAVVLSQDGSGCYKKPSTPCSCPGNCKNPPARICYYTTWSIKRNGKGKFTPEDIKGAPCTHVVFSFLLYDEQHDTIYPSDQDLVVKEDILKRLVALKSENKIILASMGGWEDSKVKYSAMMADPIRRGRIVTAITEFLVTNDLDGFDSDLEYPGAYQGNVDPSLKADKDNFVQFLKDLRYAFDAKMKELNSQKRLSLSVAVSANERIIDAAYDVPAIAAICDWIGVMLYDFHGNWENYTGHIAPFTPQPKDEGAALKFNVLSAMQLWLDRKAPACKLVAGIPCYGQAFRLTDPNNSGWHAPAQGKADPGPYTDNPGTLAFYEIIEIVKQQKWNVVHDTCIGTYAHLETQWVGYDDLHDAAQKASYAKDYCFLGTMFWSLDNECFQQDCPGGRYPLITTVTDILTGKKILTQVTNLT